MERERERQEHRMSTTEKMGKGGGRVAIAVKIKVESGIQEYNTQHGIEMQKMSRRTRNGVGSSGGNRDGGWKRRLAVVQSCDSVEPPLASTARSIATPPGVNAEQFEAAAVAERKGWGEGLPIARQERSESILGKKIL